MKTKITSFTILFIFLNLSNFIHAQALFKDLNPGVGNADPIQFMSVNNNLFFIAFTRAPSYIYQLWKSDGTVENTVMVKDTIIGGAIKDMVVMRANMNGTLFYTVNAAGSSAGGTTFLWKTDGTTPVKVDSFTYVSTKNPTVFCVIGNQLFFNMGIFRAALHWALMNFTQAMAPSQERL
ncbi:MAG: hypothetical protein NTY32_06050 [Bacteroidia bacterium]|nr:hypothetical protein [Bacteroidia bacterium]